MTSKNLTQLELVLLQLIQKGQGKWSWYELTNALSRRDVPREPDMMEVLKKLEQEGLILREVKENSPRDGYSLTDIGFRLLYNNTLEINEGKRLENKIYRDLRILITYPRHLLPQVERKTINYTVNMSLKKTVDQKRELLKL